MMRWLAMLDADRQGDFLEDMIVLATAVLTYVAALALRADGLVGVFCAGLALSHAGRWRHSLRKPTPSARVLRLAGCVERFAAHRCVLRHAQPKLFGFRRQIPF